MADRYVWTSPDGVSIDLTDEAAGYSVQADGTRGFRSVEWTVTAQQYAGQDGVDVQAIRAKENTPTLGLLLQAADEDAFVARARGLVRTMRPRRYGQPTLGRLTVSRPDGSSRHLDCYCIGGPEGDESADTTLPGRWWKLALKLYAPMPWWLGEPVPIDFGLAAPTPFFPFFPLVLSPAQIQGEFSVDLSDSDSPAYPIWTITGPGTGLTLTNVTTGRDIAITTTLTAGQKIVIDTRPGQQNVYRGDLDPADPAWGLMGALSSDPALWPLVEDINDITAVLSGASSASRISGIVEPRYAGI